MQNATLYIPSKRYNYLLSTVYIEKPEDLLYAEFLSPTIEIYKKKR